ncbi:hypothetical protein UFOVP760_39 [uncultured Caudovirales phage]|uniref:Uncharacterized protein n=1 Tax=uncultured Caudovirales phage TaxID=2100421 RepID=A0A6J7X5Z2_9CAUD|nr:hypothetical protein UFOVP760_39 [uncultured Caudovirales phage]
MKPVVTVDFDNTLAFESVTNTGWICVGTGRLLPIPKIHDLVREKHKEGFDIHVVSFREEKDKQEMVSFCKQHNLPIKSFTCTSSKTKTPILLKLKSMLHIDDSLSVCVAAKMANINVLFVDFGQLKDNSQKELAETLDSIKVVID